MIKVNQLNKYFNRRKRNEIHVLNDISLEFPDKGLVVLLGASGSGKTTLLNVIGGLDKVQSGTIDFGEMKIDGYHANTWDKIRNEHVGYIFQNYNLLPELSVFDNVAFVLKLMGIRDPQIITERVHYILNSIGMYPFRKKKSMQLSGGQMQRVAIARALVKNPKVIIADEPTGNLDSKNTIEVMNIIKEISKQKLVVLVTHEKEIAKFYGDRIIEIKDGRIIDDYLNVESLEHNLDKDDTIYLKDLKQLADQQNQFLTTSLYSDQEEIENVAVKMIIKNKTLYLDIDSSIQKIKIVDKNSKEIIIKDEHYQKKSKEEMTKTAFDLSVLDHKNDVRESKIMVSLKQTFLMALDKIIGTSIKGKLMLLAFFVSGIMIAFSVATLAAVAIVDPEPYLKLPRGYVDVEYNKWTTLNYDDVMALNVDEDESFYVNPYYGQTLSFQRPTVDSPTGEFFTTFDIIDHIKADQLIFGRMPETRYEIVVSKGIADTLTSSSFGQDMGIWSYRHLLSEVITIHNMNFKIVGIHQTNIKVSFAREDTIQLISRTLLFDIYDVLPKSMIDASLYTIGRLPLDGEIAISRDLYIQWFDEFPSGEFPITRTLLNKTITISGVYHVASPITHVVASIEEIHKMRVENSREFSIYVSNPKSFLETHESHIDFDFSDPYETARTSISEERRLALISTLSSSLVLIALAMVGFYFVIRSSLFTRIYQISVYRALGVNKSDILRSFMVEVLVITTLTTAIGYMLASYGISQLQKGLLGELGIFYVNWLSFAVGLVVAYLINLLAGLYPVMNLLKKTPAQILSDYDI